MGVDIVITWLNENDPIWLKQKQDCMDRFPVESGSDSNIRFEGWDNLRYWFRAIEKLLPWFRKICFITSGHVPDFLDMDHPKLLFVKHDDYIPHSYLPTFNSNTIEMNLHRITELSDNFVLFNDDTFPLQKIEESYYFKEDMVCDEAVEGVIFTSSFGNVSNIAKYAQVNNMIIINKYFKKRDVQKKFWDKWYCEDYGDRLERTKSLQYWNDFPGCYDPHVPSAMKKSVLRSLWELEGDALDRASSNHFRAHTDLTQYLIRYWQICSGSFHPRRTLGKVFFVDIHNYKQIAESIRKREHQMISINENCTVEEFKIIKAEINDALAGLFPEKSSFEKY